MAMVALKAGLLKNDFLFSLEKRYPKDFAEILARTEKYANTEEAWAQHGGTLATSLEEGKVMASTKAKNASIKVDEVIKDHIDPRHLLMIIG